MRVLVAGCGWLGAAIGRALVARGDRVVGVRRDPASAGALARLGIEPLVLDLAAPGAVARIPAADAVIACQAAGREGVEAYRAAYLLATGALLEAAARDGAGAFVYTGSTGVFGQRDGSEVREETPLAPAGPAADVLAEAEALVRTAPERCGVPARVVRLSGLYGPGRAGTIERVRSGALALGPGDGAFMNFCHLEDAVAFALGALARGAPGAVYHGTDASPPRRREVVAWIAARLGIEPPRSAGPGDRAGPDRRVSSVATRAALGIALRFPTFREGFEPLLPR